MDTKFDLKLKQEQELVMTPELRMAIEILQYNSFELKQYIGKKKQENPLLDMLEVEKEIVDNRSDFSYEKKDQVEYEKFIEYQPTFCEYLEYQLFEVLDKKDIKLGKFIIGSLNQDRKLTLDYEIIAEIYSNSKMEINAKHVEKIYNKIKELDLDYGCKVGSGNSEFIKPDYVIKKHNDKFKIIENQNNYPGLKINSYYLNLLKKESDEETKEYLKKKYQSALWLIKSIEQRRETIRKIIEAILEKQKDFFEKGFKFLYTMKMEEIAEIIEMHESTVSRATTSKYLQTPHGTFSLKFFFNSGIDNFSSVSVKAIISEEINNENKKTPLSDDKLAGIIEKKYNISISRRTVAKYRKFIGIESSRNRKMK